MRRRESDGVVWLEAGLPGATAAFSTRLGGVSRPPYESLNLGVLTGDERDHVLENRRRLAAALGLEPERIAIGRQVHGARVLRHSGPQRPAPFAGRGEPPPEVDAHVTDCAGLALLVFVADCLPIAVADGKTAAMVHGGWRGLAAGIVAETCSELDRAVAAIGPGIGPCCFEVGPEVLEAFASLGAGIADGRMLDLPEVAQRLLERAGVEVADRSDLCTRCNPDLFFSHRGEGPETGRQGGLIWRTT